MFRPAFLIAATLCVGACQPKAPADSPPRAAWVEMAPDHRIEIRAVSETRGCPTLTVDGRALAMIERGEPDPAFRVHVCGLTLPRAAGAVTIAGERLPLLPSRIDRIVIFGDTGCRLKGDSVQLCNVPAAWPFGLVAKQAAARHPDLVIHVGDYNYRETPCPPGVAGCAGAKPGDNWDVWWKDFFEPAAPLLRAAPWVVVRGNHELCARAGRGWFRLLDPRPARPDCVDFTPPYAVDLDGFGLAVVDSAAAEDDTAPPGLVAEFAAAFKALQGQTGEPFWIVTHRPIWALQPYGAAAQPGGLGPLNLTEHQAIDPAIPAGLDMVVSGHVHTFSTFDFGASRPAQLVVGVGGSLYDRMSLSPGSVVTIDGKAASAFSTTEYGYLVMDRTAAGWSGTLYRAGDDAVLANCDFRSRHIACR